AQADSGDRSLNEAIKKYSEQKIFCLDIGEEYQFKLKDGPYRSIRLISVEEHRDSVIGRIRKAQVNVEVSGKVLRLTCAPYVMPTQTEGVRIQADTTSGWLSLPKRVQFSIWDAKDPIVHTDRFSFPIHDYSLFSHGIQSYNEVVHLGWVDGCPKGVKAYHNYGIDFAGYEGREEIISCTKGEVIRLSSVSGYLFVVIRDDDGLIWEYGHFDSVPSQIKRAVRIEKGQKIGILGKTGPSGNFAHLHLGNYLSQADLDAGRSNRRLNLYPWLMATYQQQYQRVSYAVARPHQTVSTGEKVLFDGSNSVSFGAKIISYGWILPDGEIVDGITAEHVFDKPGVYIATLRIIDEKGRKDIDFYKVKVFTASAPEDKVPTIFMTYTPTNHIAVNQSVLFRFWFQGVKGESMEVDFGDGRVISDYVSYSEIRHRFRSPGIHIVTASCTIDGMPITQKQKVVVFEDKL
ncbi:MAG: peptidoglycan DD-metalloendopeptidase family protein, partial [Phycisphaerales bacterium]